MPSPVLFAEVFGSVSRAAAEKAGSVRPEEEGAFQNSPPNSFSSASARPTSRAVRPNKLKLSCLAG